MDEKQLQDEIERLKSISESYRHIIEENIKAGVKDGKSVEESTKSAYKFAKSMEDASKRFKKSYDEIKVQIDGLKDQYKKQNLTAYELEDSLKTLRQQVNSTTDQSKKAALIEAKSELEAANARNKATDIFKDSLGQLSGVAIAGVVKSFTGAAKSALGGGDALKVAGDFMSSQIDMANGATQVGSKALSDFGAATAGSGGKLKYLGVAASVGGAALSFFGNQVSELAKAGIGFMMSQTQKMIAGFQSLSASGAIFAGGMKEMTDTALRGNMTLEQFAKVVSENKDALAQLGMGVGEGSRRMVAAMEAGGKGAQKAMFSLGMSAEEQAATYAQVMAQMAGPSGTLKASNAEVAARTQQYAANLKLLSDLTGEDMKAKQETIRQENDNLAFQQQLDGMDEKQRLDIQESMKGMSETQRKALRENMIYGSVISKDAAIAQATNSGLQKTNDEFARKAKDGTLNLDETLKIQGQNSEEIHKAAMGNKALAMAGAAGGADAAKAAADQLKTDQLTRKLQEASTEEERKKIREQIAAGKAGGREEVNLQEVQQQFAVDMQKIARDNLPEFSKALITTVDQVKASVKGLAEMSVKAGESAGNMGKFTEYLGIAAAGMQGLMTVFDAVKGFKGGGGVGGALKGAVGLGGGGATAPAAGSLSGWKSGATAVSQAAEGAGSTIAKGVGTAATAAAESGGGLLKGAGKLLGKAGGPLGALVGIGMAAKDYSDISDKEKAGKITAEEASKQKGGAIGEAGGGLAGGLAGAASGAAMGALLGPIGAAVGGIVGGIAGGFGGGKLGKWGGESLMGGEKKPENGMTTVKMNGMPNNTVATNAMPNLTMMNQRERMEALEKMAKDNGSASSDSTANKAAAETMKQQADMIEIMKKQSDMFERQLTNSEELKRIMSDHKDVTQQLSYNMS